MRAFAAARCAPVLLALAIAGCGAAPPPCPEAAPAAAASARARQPAPAPSPPSGSIAVRPVTVQPMDEGFVLLLADEGRTRVLPIVIGLAEAQIIDLRLRGQRFERPLTHDLLDTLVARLGGEVVYVHIDKLRGGVFVGSIYVWNGHELLRIDSRTSDAVAVALGNDAPIYVAPSVMEEAAQSIPDGEGDPL